MGQIHKNRVDSLLSDLTKLGYTVDLEIDELLKSLFSHIEADADADAEVSYDGNLIGYVKKTQELFGNLSHTFDVTSSRSYMNALQFVAGVNFYENKLSFIIYGCLSHIHKGDGQLFRPVYVTFFKPSDRSSLINIINHALVNSVLTS